MNIKNIFPILVIATLQAGCLDERCISKSCYDEDVNVGGTSSIETVPDVGGQTSVESSYGGSSSTSETLTTSVGGSSEIVNSYGGTSSVTTSEIPTQGGMTSTSTTSVGGFSSITTTLNTGGTSIINTTTLQNKGGTSSTSTINTSLPNSCVPILISLTCKDMGYQCGESVMAVANTSCVALVLLDRCAVRQIGVCGRTVTLPASTVAGDGCGNALNCGTCPSGQVCGWEGPGKCGISKY